ncbi:glycerophosphodiester phosphodiesterase family protein [Novipirellula artificiosorum]|uniref:Putative glycerophosphoryl diester phosphodiesterase 1 n=1 Tax=Novipirellula artificiosorum TaxID=2528016 RepID=A0A5C6DW65_9BACT|nr:glycerophosphodiester phosphodiesterase family protein [Novipirellula artificiosorum]TWU40484.1 putative glycerophosphoryl diester phosphodiesterase 1 [Novipirellula artificiosorum]
MSFDWRLFGRASAHPLRWLTIVVFGVTCLAGMGVTGLVHAQMIVGHRGASEDAPENTVAAFQLAWEQQADGIEGDFYLASDSEIVCIHDKTTRRTTAQDVNVESSTLAELRELDAGNWKGAKWNGERIPTFADVMATVPEGRTFVIELKSDVRIVEPLKRELDRIDHSKIKLLIIAFDEANVKACKERMPDVEVHWLTSFKQVEKGGSWSPTPEQIADTVRRSGADGVGMKGMVDLIDQPFIDRLLAGGCSTFHVWTIDSPDEAKYYANLGAVGITTNRPAVIRDALKAIP